MGDCYKKAVAELRAGNWENARDLVIKGATEEGCGMCMWWMYDAYNEVYWFEESEALAIDWLKKAVFTTHPVALAQAHYNGLISLSDEQKDLLIRTNDSFSLSIYCSAINSLCGRSWSYRAALEGNIFAMLELITNYDDDSHEGNPWIKLAIDTGYAVSLWQRGERLCCAGHCIEAIPLLKKSAAQGYWHACLQLAECCYAHDHVAQLFWLQKLMATFDPNTKDNNYPKRRVLKIMKDKQRIFSSIERCRAASLQLICIRQYRESILSVLPKDVVRLIAKTLWKTTWHEEDVWAVTGSASAEPVFKKIKQ